MQKEVIIGMVITIVLLLLVIIWAIFVHKEKYRVTDEEIDANPNDKDGEDWPENE